MSTRFKVFNRTDNRYLLVLYKESGQAAIDRLNAEYPLADWLHDPDTTPVTGLLPRYWKVGAGDVLEPMTEQEQTAVDEAVPQVLVLSIPETLAYNVAEASTSGDDSQKVPLDALAYADTAAFELTGSSEVRCLISGTLLIQADVGLAPTTNNRIYAQAWIEINGIQLAGTIGAVACEVDNWGNSATLRGIVEVDANDVISIVFARVKGKGNPGVKSVSNACRLHLRYLAG